MKTNVRKMVSVMAVGALATIAAAGCERRDDTTAQHGPTTGPNNDHVGTTTVTNGTAGLSNGLAVGRIVAARCAREQACNNVGVDKHYTNPQACTQKISADMKDDLNAKDCPNGIDQRALDDCMQAIRSEQCNNPLDSLSRITKCRTADLCLKK